MANMQAISRLYAAEPQTEPVKLPDSGNSQAEVSMLAMQERFLLTQARRRRFALPGETVSEFDSPALMSTIAPTSIPEGRATFTGMAAQQARAAFVRRMATQAQRGAGHPQAWAPIQI
jgi:hypothetical protein